LGSASRGDAPRKAFIELVFKRRKTERIVDESIHFRIVPAEPVERRASWFKRSIHQLHWILVRGHRLNEARQAIQSAGPGKDQAVDGMTMVKNELLRGERTHAVAQQNVRLARVLVLPDDHKREYVFDELIETARPEITETSGRFCGQAMAPMIVSVNGKVSAAQGFSQFRIAPHVLTESIGDLNDSANMVMSAPFHARNGKAVST
jgi:hypothetical protein